MSVSSATIQKVVTATLSAAGSRIEENSSKIRQVFSRHLENKMAHIEALPNMIGKLMEKTKQSASVVEKRIGSKLQHIAAGIKKQASAGSDTIAQTAGAAVHEIKMRVDDEYRSDVIREEFLTKFDKRQSLGL